MRVYQFRHVGMFKQGLAAQSRAAIIRALVRRVNRFPEFLRVLYACFRSLGVGCQTLYLMFAVRVLRVPFEWQLKNNHVIDEIFLKWLLAVAAK
jgi:hypothetical protein